MNNGENQINQTIPGVRIAPPSEKPIDATTNDVGAANVKSSVVNNVTSSATIPTVTNVGVPQAPATVSVNAMPVNQGSVTVEQTVGVPVVNSVAQDGNISNPPIAEVDGKKNKPKKRKNRLARFFFFIIVLLIGGLAYLWYYHQEQLRIMNIKCTPVSTSGKVKELDLNSTIVKDLYGKVKTNIREDIASTELNDQMKIYLAYRQIATNGFYESNCNKFNSQGMEPFKCEETVSFSPKAFKEDTIHVELKKLFGDDTNITNQNVQLGKSCIGGFQYIAERGEYVQGKCESTGVTLFSVDKTLVKATSTESIIELYEDVKYYGNEGYEVSDKLVSGRYKYTFKLDMNYNYIYVSKTLTE